MPRASELQVLLSVAERLREELGSAAADEVPGAFAPADREQLEAWGPVDVEDARLVARLTGALAAIAAAAAAQADQDEDASFSKRATALTGIELVMRGELMRGNAAALREQLPGFVFVVVLPSAGMDLALEVANRATVLLEETLG